MLPASLALRLSRLKVAISGRRARGFPEKEASRAPYCRLQAVSSPVRCLLACSCEDSRRYGVQVQCDYSRKVAARREGGEASEPGASCAAKAVQALVYACARGHGAEFTTGNQIQFNSIHFSHMYIFYSMGGFPLTFRGGGKRADHARTGQCFIRYKTSVHVLRVHSELRSACPGSSLPCY